MEPCSEHGGVAIEACMSVRGSLTNVVGADEEDPMLILLLKLEPDQCFLKTIGALREALSARPARQGRASVQANIAASAA